MQLNKTICYVHSLFETNLFPNLDAEHTIRRQGYTAIAHNVDKHPKHVTLWRGQKGTT